MMHPEARCSSGHPLGRYDAPMGERGLNGLGCDLCSRFFPCSIGYFNCAQGCDYDVCARCVEQAAPKPEPLPQPLMIHPSAKCSSGHSLGKYEDPLEERGKNGLGCDFCQKFFPCSLGYYNCGQGCDYDVCAKCLETPVPVPEPVPEPEPFVAPYQEDPLQKPQQSDPVKPGSKSRRSPEFLKAITYVESVINKGKPFTDSDFPPELSSLANKDDKPDKISKMNNTQWKRASEIYPKQEVFIDGIEPNDINQGALGNCYFLAVLSAMAEFPDRVQACFHTKTVNDAGIYLMRFYINGAEYPVYVDDYLPVRHNRPCFSSSRVGELWVILLEKAWAKL